MQSQLIVLGGPTGAGKTALAIELAIRLNAEIINADSRQFFREIPIGTATPSTDELKRIPHHLIGNLSLFDTYTVSHFEKDASQLISRLSKRLPYIILCGGSGLYLKAATEGLDEIPATDPVLREKLNHILEKEGLPALLRIFETERYPLPDHLDLKNPRRVMRALEIAFTGGLIKKEKKHKLPTHFFYLDMDREILYNRINHRVDLMMEAGLEEEARTVYPYKHLNSLQTVGYKELFSFFDGEITREKAIDLIKQHSRNYAKRQLTWFRNQGTYQQVDALQQPLDAILKQID